MSRVPAALQPLFPVIKRGHLAGARVLGAAARRSGPIGASRVGLPVQASATSHETAALPAAGATVHTLTPARERSWPHPAGDPHPLAFWSGLAHQQVPERFVLELAEGRVRGEHLAVIAADGTLDFETSPYFGVRDWREHPVFWDLRRGEEAHVGTAALLAARGTGRNYFHFVIDALPRLGMIAEALPGVSPDVWVANASTRYEQQYLDLLGLDRDRILEPGPRFRLRADRLLVPSLPNDAMQVLPETVTWLRERFAPERTTGLPRRIYVTRGQRPRTRRVVQESALVGRLAREGFTVIDPGKLSVQQQIDHFAAAEVIVAPHGAGLTNLVYTRPGVRLLELFAPGYLNNGYWSIIGNVADSRYRYLVAPERGRERNNGLMDDITLDPGAVMDALHELLDTP